MYGDPAHVGALMINASHADVADVGGQKKLTRAATRMLRIAPYCASADGVFYQLLHARGDIIRPHGSDAYVIRCPNELAHTSGETGDTSTLLYRPGFGQSIGTIHCFHGHCSNLRLGDWLAMFGEPEIAAARSG